MVLIINKFSPLRSSSFHYVCARREAAKIILVSRKIKWFHWHVSNWMSKGSFVMLSKQIVIKGVARLLFDKLFDLKTKTCHQESHLRRESFRARIRDETTSYIHERSLSGMCMRNYPSGERRRCWDWLTRLVWKVLKSCLQSFLEQKFANLKLSKSKSSQSIFLYKLHNLFNLNLSCMSCCTSLSLPIANKFFASASHCSESWSETLNIQQSLCNQPSGNFLLTQWKIMELSVAYGSVRSASDVEQNKTKKTLSCCIWRLMKWSEKCRVKDLEHDRQKICCDEIKLFLSQAARREHFVIVVYFHGRCVTITRPFMAS